MNALTALHFDTADIRMVLRDDEPWWVLADVAAALGLNNPSKLAGRLEEYQKADIPIRDTSSGQNRRVIIVNEAGVYQMALASRKPVARRFAKWLFTEVLPSIRQFGMFPPPNAQQIAANDPYDGFDKPTYVRFREERLRWEAETGLSLRERPGFTGYIVTQLERGVGDFQKTERLKTMIKIEMDVLYVLTGKRTKTQQEREYETRARAIFIAAATRPLMIKD